MKHISITISKTKTLTLIKGLLLPGLYDKFHLFIYLLVSEIRISFHFRHTAWPLPMVVPEKRQNIISSISSGKRGTASHSVSMTEDAIYIRNKQSPTIKQTGSV